MPVITVRGKTAEDVWEKVRDCIHLLEDSRRYLRFRGEERYRAELRLCAFVIAVMYGESGPRRYGYKSYVEFLEAMDSIHGAGRGFVKLKTAKAPLTLRIVLGRAIEALELNLGYAEGVTTVIPLTKAGRDEYLRAGGEFDPMEFPAKHPEYVAPPNSAVCPGDNCFIYISTMFHIPAIAFLAKQSGEVEFSPGVPNPAVPLMGQLFGHIAKFMPRLGLADFGVFLPKGLSASESPPVCPNGQEVSFRPGTLPMFFGVAANSHGEKLIESSGFKLTEKQGAYPQYMLDVSDINKLKHEIIGKSERKRLQMARDSLKFYFYFQARADNTAK